jgi:hypothetical protein
MVTGSFPGLKLQGLGLSYPSEFSSEVKAIPLLSLWALMASSKVEFLLTNLVDSVD